MSDEDISSSLDRAERALERIDRALGRITHAEGRDEALRQRVREAVAELDLLIREAS